MNTTDDQLRILNEPEKKIYDNLLTVLSFKNITIDDSILIDYIRNHSLTNIYITTEIIDRIIKECLQVQQEKNKPDYDTISEMSNLGDNSTKVLESIISNVNTTNIPTKENVIQKNIAFSRELREEMIYIRGVSGDAGKFTNTFLLTKRINNVESIELISGYIVDDRSGTDGPGRTAEDGFQTEVTYGDPEVIQVAGSIGAAPFMWIDITEPRVEGYTHYSNYSVSGCVPNCSAGCEALGKKCETTAEDFVSCTPFGSFLVELKHYDFEVSDYGSGAGRDASNSTQNIIHVVDKCGNYKKKFTQLISMNKLKINIRNVLGKTLWGYGFCEDIRGGGTTNEFPQRNILRFEFVFKVKYYINTLENNFLLHN
jgi:hypothetical protein